MTGQTTLVSPIEASSTASGMTVALTTDIHAKDRGYIAQMKLVTAAAALVLITFVCAFLLVVRKAPSGGDTTAAADLTYSKPTAAPTDLTTTAVTMKETTTMATTRKQRFIRSSPFLCIFGSETNATTLFPVDHLCDIIIFDSAYKKNMNIPLVEPTFGEGLKSLLAAASRYNKTEFGVAFSYLYLEWLTTDLEKTNPTMLDVFWRSGIFHFGIIDMPASNVSYDNIAGVFAALKRLSMLAMKRPATLGKPHIVLGAVPQNYADYYALKMRDVYTPTLFISQGHYAFGDNTVADCKVSPPTMLRKPVASQGYTYDLTDALSALQKIQDEGVSSKWMVSVSMKGRWTVVKPNFPLELSSECKSDQYAKSFGSYAEVPTGSAHAKALVRWIAEMRSSVLCTDVVYSKNLKYIQRLETMYTYHRFHRTMFVYDNEEGLCRKICQLYSKSHNLKFGIAVYDLEYDDYQNTCSGLNHFGAFSRLVMLRHVVDILARPYTSETCEDDARCPSSP